MSSSVVVTSERVLSELRQLPPREQLWVIAQALPEAVGALDEPRQPLPSLRGLWQHLGFDLSAEEIDEARREAWGGFPRKDI